MKQSFHQKHFTPGNLKDPFFTSFHFLSNISSILRLPFARVLGHCPINFYPFTKITSHYHVPIALKITVNILMILSWNHKFGFTSRFLRNSTAWYPYKSGVATQSDLDLLEGPRFHGRATSRRCKRIGEWMDGRTDGALSVGRWASVQRSERTE